MRITILGSGTSIPHPQRASPGLVIRWDETTILVDPSSGSLHRAERYGTSTKSIDYVFLSHFHPDHTGDIAPLLFALRNSEYFKAQPLTLLGPSGLREFHRGLLDFYGDWIRLEPGRLEIQEINDCQQLDGGSVRSFPVVHTNNSLGFQFTDSKGKVFAYSGDTDYCPGLIELAKRCRCRLDRSLSALFIEDRGSTHAPAGREGGSGSRRAPTHHHPPVPRL